MHPETTLTDAQIKAVQTTEGPVLVIAGPGTGKSKVITERVAYLVSKKSVDPGNILVSTFTVKAAEELKDRLRLVIGNKVENMHISTIHSFCQMMLEEYSDAHRLGASFSVLDEEDQYIFVKSGYGYQFGLKDHLQPYEISPLITTFNRFTENNIEPLELIEHCKENGSSEREIAIAEAYDKYIVALQSENLVDFANLQKELLHLIESNENIKTAIKERFKYILIDEYQDTNPIQDKIFMEICNESSNICVVGDEDQSIYGFRGASTQNFLKFPERYSDTKVLKLEKNFRSSSDIVDFCDNFIKEHRAYPKKVYAQRDNLNRPILIKGQNIGDEAKQTVEFIKNLYEDKKIKHYGDIAILFRSVRNHSEFYVKYLREANIPYYVIGDGAFLSKEEVRTILYLMAFCEGHQPTDKQLEYWKWWDNTLLLNSVIDLSNDAKTKLGNDILSSDFLEKATYDGLAAKGLEKSEIFKLLRLVDKRTEVIKEGEKKKKYSLTQLFYDILKRTGYLKKIIDQNDPGSELQKYNLGLLSHIIYKYESTTHNNNFKHFFEHLYYLPDDKSHNSAFIEETNAIKLMTVHQAKGLEFPVVILGSVTKNRFPSSAAKRESEFFTIPEKLRLYNNQYDALAEERRLFYVAMTRAQDLLVVATTDGEGKKLSEYIQDDIGVNNFARPEHEFADCQKTYEEPDDIPRLSYSAINNFLSCPFRYSLNYLYKFQTPPTFYQNYGTVVHNALQKIHLDLKDGKTVEIERIKEITNSVWIPVYFDKRKDDNMKGKLVEYLWNYVRKGTKRYKEILDVEKPFSFIGEKFIIRGKVDLISKDSDDSISIIDFKSRNIEGVEETMVDIQLRMYHLALEHEYSFDNLYAYTFLDNMRTKFDNSKEKLEETKEIMIDVGTKIKEEKFERNLHSKFCKKCMYSFLCY
ncbi:ATP-dependent helicase [Candidatus Woesearchaeota archaeon]|nr:ATP-dependent helicase [Candidatus Woesearchaeota archaeon]